MKNQYFGDINDYRKYGLIRAILSASGLRILVAWMLTPDDKSTDGKFTEYLAEPEKWAHHDPELYGQLQTLMANCDKRRVELIEGTSLLPRARYFSDLVPDDAAGRAAWLESLLNRSSGFDMVFLDPDNGLEVKSKPWGRKDSSKFLFWREVSEIWETGASLLIYQHFTREKRADFIRRKLAELQEAAPGSTVEAFSTSRVVFFMALQPNHQKFHHPIVKTVQKRWDGQITPSA